MTVALQIACVDDKRLFIWHGQPDPTKVSETRGNGKNRDDYSKYKCTSSTNTQVSYLASGRLYKRKVTMILAPGLPVTGMLPPCCQDRRE